MGERYVVDGGGVSVGEEEVGVPFGGILLAVLNLHASVCRLGLCGLLGGLTDGLLLLCGGALGHGLGLCTGLSNNISVLAFCLIL